MQKYSCSNIYYIDIKQDFETFFVLLKVITINKMFFITKLLFVVMITLHKTIKVSFYYLMPI